MEKVKEFLQDVGIELVDLVKFFRYQMIIPLQVINIPLLLFQILLLYYYLHILGLFVCERN